VFTCSGPKSCSTVYMAKGNNHIGFEMLGKLDFGTVVLVA
jgi:hypothetical protein